jgi:hypothetical protein
LLKFKIYHPYVCKPEVTGLTFEGATQHMQMINHSYEYLREYFNTLNEVEHKDKRERGDNWTNLPYHQHANGANPKQWFIHCFLNTPTHAAKQQLIPALFDCVVLYSLTRLTVWAKK